MGAGTDAGALLVQGAQARVEIAVTLLVLTALAWALPLLRLWSTVQVQTEELLCVPVPEAQPLLTPEVQQLLGDIRQTVEVEIQRIDTTLDQTPQLLRDTVIGLNEIFTGLDTQTQTQPRLVRAVLGDITAHGSADQASYLTMQEFTQATSAVLQYFIDLVVNISKQSVQTAYTIDDMVRQMDAMCALLANIKTR